MEKLAIEGGSPVRESSISYGCQWVDEKDIKEVVDILRGPLITCGPKVAEAEIALEKYLDVPYVTLVSNGTAALHCACAAAGIGPGDEVITTPLTFAASANCILYCGGRPIFADINEKTYNIDPESIEEHITKKTKAILVVDFAGQSVMNKEIKEICEKYGLVLIEDAAHAIGTYYENKPVGSIADITCFSFHPVKTITAGEGGAVATINEDYHKKIRLFRTHGITKNPSEMRMQDVGLWYYEQLNLGYNYRITDFQAALLCSQLGKIEEFKKRRRQIVEKYNEAFKNVPEIILQEEIVESDTCNHLYIIRLDLEKLNCTRRQFFDALGAENVQPQVHYLPVYWFPYYQELGYKKGLCPKAEAVYESIMSIPLYPKMSDGDVDDVIHAVTKVIENYRL